ncbi:hypothetical protein AB0L64_30870 [Kribbella sp. NPDC051936]|uniref:hypothetical protein n=1 Tax=Kribbella sp. NPDC051936 TaxID=3154946 RepID=UPI0034240FC1
MPPSKSTATSSDGTRLAIYTYGESGAPVLVCVHGIKLYRANVVPRLLRPAPRRTGVPVLTVSPDADPFVTTPLQTGIEAWAPNLTVKVIRGGHWMPRNDPGLVAGLVRDHTRKVARWET